MSYLYFKKVFLCLAASLGAFSMSHGGQADLAKGIDTGSAAKATLYAAGALAVGAVTYGGYSCLKWLVDPKNRALRACSNARIRLLETELFLKAIGIDPENIVQQVDISDLMERLIAFSKYHVAAIDSLSSFKNMVKKLLLGLEVQSSVLGISIAQLDYCLSHYSMSINQTEINGLKSKIVRIKDTIDTIIVPELQGYLAGVVEYAQYSIESSCKHAYYAYIVYPFYPIF